MEKIHEGGFEKNCNRNLDRRVCGTALVPSEQRGVSLGVESAQARTGRPSSPISVAGVARRQYRRSGYGLFAAAVAATTSPWNYEDYFCYGAPYAGRGYPPGGYYRSYPGGYCLSRSDVTGLYGRPTLFPRYYVGW